VKSGDGSRGSLLVVLGSEPQATDTNSTTSEQAFLIVMRNSSLGESSRLGRLLAQILAFGLFMVKGLLHDFHLPNYILE
jgi:hypothetical protein